MKSIIQIKSVSAITSMFNEQIIGVERCGIVVSALFAALSVAGKKIHEILQYPQVFLTAGILNKNGCFISF